MKLSVMAFIATGFLLISGIAFAQEGLAGGAISISASEKGFFAPDTAEIMLAVETTQPSVQLASQENAGRAAALVSALNVFVNEKAGDSIKTSQYSVRPVYEWNDQQKQNVLTGYRAINQVLVKTHRMDVVERIIDAALAAGANRVDTLDFSLVKETSNCGELIAKAAMNARQEAQVLATALGVKLGKIKSADPSCGPVSTGGPGGQFTAMAAKARKPSKTPIEAGQIELKATVRIVFRIE